MCEFNKEDVLTLARAIVEWPIEYTYHIGNVSEYFCKYCEAEYYNMNSFKHEPNCPVLIAQDVLTGNE